MCNRALNWIASTLLILGAGAGLLGAESAPTAGASPLPYPPNLTVGSELDYPPFALVKNGSEADGFTVELWNAVAREAGIVSTVRTGPFHLLLGQFRTGEVDVMINLAQSDARREFCYFAVPHVTMYGALFVREGEAHVRSDAELKDRELIVLNRDLAHDYAISRGWTNHLILVNDAASGLELLASGKHDAMLVGKLVGLNTLKERNIRRVKPLPERIGFQQKFAFAVLKDRPGSAELLARINEGLALVQASGSYDALYERWFGVLEPHRITLRQVLVYLVPFLVLTGLASAAYAIERRLRLRTKESVSLLNATLEATEDAILAVDREGRVSAFNKRLVAQGLIRESGAVAGADARAEVFQRFADSLENPTEYHSMLRKLNDKEGGESMDTFRLRDGRCFEVASKAKHIDGVESGRVWSFRDVTRREQAAEEIRRFNAELELRVKERTRQLELASLELQRLSNVAATTRNGVIICDPSGRIEWVNRSFEANSGWSLAEIKGRRPGEFLQGRRTDRGVASSIHQAIETRKPIRFTILNYRKSGEPYWIEADINPVFDHTGNLISFVSVQNDITERKAAEEQLRRQSEMLSDLNANLEQALRSREGFLAAMSHELRTPLHGVLGFTELLSTELHGPLNDTQRGFLERVEESANHLLELITDILDLAKFRSETTVLNRVDCNVEEICAASLRQVEASALGKEQTLSLDAQPPGLVLRADPTRLKQVLVNLLSNAVKFTPKGGRVGLRTWLEPNEVHFEVWDTGIGIPAASLSKLFQPFVQLDSRLSREHSGTGLGLALVHQLMEAHGGRIEVSSQPGVGSRFVAVFPFDGPAQIVPPAQPVDHPTEASQIRPSQPQPLAGICVLVAEDNAANQFAIKTFLEARGAKVLVAETGAQAIELAESAQPAIILMDIQMPKMDGLEATRRIRALVDPRVASVPIIALTALAMPGDKEQCFASGCNAYLPKPVSLRSLPTQILALVEPRTSSQP